MVLRLTPFPAKFLANIRLRLLFPALFTLLLVGIVVTYRYQRDCPHEELLSTASTVDRPLDDVLVMEPMPQLGRSIFFVETSRIFKPRSEIKYNMLQLTARQACAIESAALHHPNLQVFVLFATPTYRHTGNYSQGQPPIIDAVLSYKNVELRQLNIKRYASGTPIDEWVRYGELFDSSFLVSHISDLLRYITLYRFGGIYLDLDVVVLRNLEDVPPNYAGVESASHLAAGVMSMAPTGFGHEVAKSCLLDFQQHFNGMDWGNNGPGVITRVAQKICSTTNITLMLDDRKRCRGFNVFNHTAFYAVPWEHWRHFFEPEYLQQTLALTKDSYVVHVWNRSSKQLAIKVGSSTAYGKIAEQHCPRSYAAAGEYF